MIFPLWQYNTYQLYASLPPSLHLSLCRSKRSVQSTKQENVFASASWLLNLFANLQPILILSVCLSLSILIPRFFHFLPSFPHQHAFLIHIPGLTANNSSVHAILKEKIFVFAVIHKNVITFSTLGKTFIFGWSYLGWFMLKKYPEITILFWLFTLT